MAVLRLALAALAIFVFAERCSSEDVSRFNPTPIKLEVSGDGGSKEATQSSQIGTSLPLEWFTRTGRANVSGSGRQRPRPLKQGALGGTRLGGALAPLLLAASSLLPILFTALAALAGKAFISSLLALAVAAFNLLRSFRQQHAHKYS